MVRNSRQNNNRLLYYLCKKPLWLPGWSLLDNRLFRKKHFRQCATAVISVFQSSRFKRLSMLAGVSLAVGWLLSPTTSPYTTQYRAADIAWSDVRAPRDLLVEDSISTEKRRLEMERNLSMIYDLDPKALPHAENKLKEAFDFMRELYPDPPEQSEEPSTPSMRKAPSVPSLQAEALQKEIENRRKLFEKKLGFLVSDEVYDALKNHRFHKRIEDYIYAIA